MNKTAYDLGALSAYRAFGLEKTALVPLVGAALAGGAKFLGGMAARAGIGAGVRAGAAALGRKAVAAAPGVARDMAIQTGAGMAMNHMLAPKAPTAPGMG